MMRIFTTIALTLGVVLCAPVGASASNGVAPTYKYHAHYRVAFVAISPQATAFVPVTPKKVDDDSDGLSRNVEDCNRGCIGGN
jgi:hypothetical protein